QPDKNEKGEGTFLLTVVPPQAHSKEMRPRDLAFVLDRSGSMNGWKMVAARRAVARMVETLLDQDRFNVYAFDSTVETPPGIDTTQLAPATSKHRFEAAEFLQKTEARGGTEMAKPLELAVKALMKGERDRDRTLVLVTDGQVGNEDQILRHLAIHLK